MNWVLLIYFSWTHPAAEMMRFPNQESCQQAGRWFDKHATVSTRWTCMQDITIDIPPPVPTETTHDEGLQVPEKTQQ